MPYLGLKFRIIRNLIPLPTAFSEWHQQEMNRTIIYIFIDVSSIRGKSFTFQHFNYSRSSVKVHLCSVLHLAGDVTGTGNVPSLFPSQNHIFPSKGGDCGVRADKCLCSWFYVHICYGILLQYSSSENKYPYKFNLLGINISLNKWNYFINKTCNYDITEYTIKPFTTNCCHKRDEDVKGVWGRIENYSH